MNNVSKALVEVFQRALRRQTVTEPVHAAPMVAKHRAPSPPMRKQTPVLRRASDTHDRASSM